MRIKQKKKSLDDYEIFYLGKRSERNEVGIILNETI